MRLISCQNVTMGYEGKKALDQVSFWIETGDYLCILGENGSGKSTLLKGLLGLIKPWQGSILFQGIQQSQIGYLPQQSTIARDFPASVQEVVLSGRLNRGRRLPWYSKEDRAAAQASLARLGIPHLGRRSLQELSGGQRQRVLLARALCATENILFLDEPVAGLDPQMTADFYAITQQLNQQEGITIVMVSHDIKNALAHGNKILHLAQKQIFWGDVGQYLGTEIGRRMAGNG